jgi:transposase
MREREQKRYDAAFRADAVALVERRSLVEVAEDLGVPKSTLWYWYEVAKRKRKVPRVALASSPKPAEASADEKIARLERMVEQLQKRNQQLEMDREILKKAAAFFAKESE